MITENARTIYWLYIQFYLWIVDKYSACDCFLLSYLPNFELFEYTFLSVGHVQSSDNYGLVVWINIFVMIERREI